MDANELGEVIVKTIRAGVDGEIACLPPEMRSVPFERLMLGIAIELETALTKPKPAPNQFHESDWVLCPYGPADEQVGQVTAIGTGASSGLLVFRLLSGRCTGAHVSNVQLLPPRPRPDQLPPGKRLTGECRVTTEKDQWAVYYEPGTTKIWDIRGPGLSAHPEPFHGHRWIVEDVPAEAPEPSQPPDLAQALLGARGMLGALSDLARKRGLSSVVQSLGLLIGQDDSARR